MRFGIDQARRAWLTANDVLNTRPLAPRFDYLPNQRIPLVEDGFHLILQESRYDFGCRQENFGKTVESFASERIFHREYPPTSGDRSP